MIHPLTSLLLCLPGLYHILSPGREERGLNAVSRQNQAAPERRVLCVFLNEKEERVNDHLSGVLMVLIR